MGETEVQHMCVLYIPHICRIMKRSLPANAKIAKDAKETAQECVSEFISFVTSEASDKCLREKRKTINGDDLLWAIHTLGFEEYIEPLSMFLQQHREVCISLKHVTHHLDPSSTAPLSLILSCLLTTCSNPFLFSIASRVTIWHIFPPARC